MFFVKDDQLERHKLIRSFLTADGSAIAVILAAIDFEWTLRRAILLFGTNSTKDILGKALKKAFGADKYKKAWRDEVSKNLHKNIDEVIPHWSRLVDPEKGAFALRGSILHGARVSVSPNFAKTRVEDFLIASSLLEQLAKDQNKSLYKRIVRTKTRAIKES